MKLSILITTAALLLSVALATPCLAQKKAEWHWLDCTRMPSGNWSKYCTSANWEKYGDERRFKGLCTGKLVRHWPYISCKEVLDCNYKIDLDRNTGWFKCAE
ncbi:hypothetical protein [Desulfovibrio sp. JC010]|uniref:hypothetical protein n=1 Tax=Desulfovibrio sp. JC010 TaxID=2593641 RepID=UPI0013D63F67|nr:hypothetical protein [Desulfovibrio sp. JC010]NDV28487.1 hypothetical protein [Desulfovibrio sp. JC010]